jgi:Diacylglycerol kinase accessory domain
MLEVVGVTGVVHLGQIQSGLRSAMRIAQVSMDTSPAWLVSSFIKTTFVLGWTHQNSPSLGYSSPGRRRTLGAKSRRCRGSEVSIKGMNHLVVQCDDLIPQPHLKINFHLFAWFFAFSSFIIRHSSFLV